MAGQHLLHQRRSGTRHAHHEDGPRVVEAEARTFREERPREELLHSGIGCRMAGEIEAARQKLLSQDEILEGLIVLAEIVADLGIGVVQPGAVILGQALA